MEMVQTNYMERPNEHYWRTVSLTAEVAGLIVFVLAYCTGCTTERKAKAWFDKHEPKKANMCHIEYPCIDSVHTEYKYVQGDTQYIQGDTVYALSHDTVMQTVTKRVVRVDTVYKDKVTYQTDKAELSVLQAKYNEQTEHAIQISVQRDNAVKSAVKWRNWALGSIGFILIALAGFIVGKSKGLV